MCDWSYVNTRASYYSGAGIEFLGVPALDVKHCPIETHFQVGYKKQLLFSLCFNFF